MVVTKKRESEEDVAICYGNFCALSKDSRVSTDHKKLREEECTLEKTQVILTLLPASLLCRFMSLRA